MDANYKSKIKNKIKIKLFNQKIKMVKELRNRWSNLKKFESPYDIPPIPIVNKKEYDEFFIPKIIECGGIPKKDLIDGEYYIGSHRCAKIAQWNEKENKFNYWKFEFFPIFDDCNHFEDDDGYSLFVPLKIGTKEEFDKTGYEYYINQKENGT
jgi:hypothetical protein